MKTIFKIIKDLPWFLWSGWGSIASIFLFIAFWDFGNQIYGDLVLSSPKEVFITIGTLFSEETFLNDLILTVKRGVLGFTISLVIGTILGLLAGFFITASVMSRPIVTILVGIPPIAWIVLAMIWFGFGDMTVMFTVVIASFPIIFVGALQGSRTLEGDLSEMMNSFNLSFLQKCKDLYFPHLFSYLFPSWVSALGMSWKIVIMAELLSSNDGIGAALAVARSHLDTPTALALVSTMIGVLLFVEYIILEPIKREVESWRD
ncbi:ABC transporter permease [Arcobacter cloacae]|uniref:ABC transporter permease n=1 Tax=Arcobacter cloacae TaxID=1054034 RepID=A0A6M8NAA8_9BACT|nr:ABC transporter permease subunit [Arcobacter cloacae]QKF91103.1 nitrate/sulfonate/bicarbonate ABC transporter, permease protein [Arcobacter cloacae]RXI38928.1 ABC transporter permease [Arcobacter cloacae]